MTKELLLPMATCAGPARSSPEEPAAPTGARAVKWSRIIRERTIRPE